MSFENIKIIDGKKWKLVGFFASEGIYARGQKRCLVDQDDNVFLYWQRKVLKIDDSEVLNPPPRPKNS